MCPSSRFKLTTVFSLLLIFVIGLALLNYGKLTTHAASTSITLSITSGPPTTRVTVRGTGFGSTEKVIIDLDITQVGTINTGSIGAFISIIRVPKSASPGTHVVLAIGQTSKLAAQGAFLVQTNWPSFGFNPQLTHFNPYENVLNPSNVSRLTLDWKYPITSNLLYSASPIVANGVIYAIPIIGSVNFYNEYTGAYIGSIDTPPSAASSLALTNGVVYVGASWSVYALGISTSTVWKTVTTGGQVSSSPTVVNGVVYFGSDDHKLYAVNTSTGTILWSFTTGGDIRSTPAVNNGIVYIGSEDGKLYALNAVTGHTLWNVSLGVYDSSPAVANGVVYIGGDGLYAIKALTGAILWKAPSGSGFSSPAVAKGVVYIGNTAVNAATGHTLWTATNASGPTVTAPTVANGVVYIGSVDHHLYALNASTGAFLWTYTTGNNVNSPVVVNGIVYASSVDGSLYAFHLPT